MGRGAESGQELRLRGRSPHQQPTTRLVCMLGVASKVSLYGAGVASLGLWQDNQPFFGAKQHQLL